MTRLTLFATAGCHLCEQAHALIEPHLGGPVGTTPTLEIVDIAESTVLTDRYGILIPVLRNEDSGVELNWPFRTEDVGKIL